MTHFAHTVKYFRVLEKSKTNFCHSYSFHKIFQRRCLSLSLICRTVNHDLHTRDFLENFFLPDSCMNSLRTHDTKPWISCVVSSLLARSFSDGKTGSVPSTATVQNFSIKTSAVLFVSINIDPCPGTRHLHLKACTLVLISICVKTFLIED